MNIKIAPKNWKKFQHYTGRTPPWIKLHRSLLDDYKFHCLPIASKALAPGLWLLASEYENGLIDAAEEEVAFRLRVSTTDLRSAIKSLLDNGFFVDASGMLAECYQDATLETEIEADTEVEEETETRTKRAIARVQRDINLFGEFDTIFWKEWPNKVGKTPAAKAWIAIRKKGHSVETIMHGLSKYIEGKPTDRHWLNPSTFLNQERFLDQPAQVGGQKETLSQYYARLAMEGEQAEANVYQLRRD